jgi:hypothetical protein
VLCGLLVQSRLFQGVTCGPATHLQFTVVRFPDTHNSLLSVFQTLTIHCCQFLRHNSLLSVFQTLTIHHCQFSRHSQFTVVSFLDTHDSLLSVFQTLVFHCCQFSRHSQFTAVSFPDTHNSLLSVFQTPSIRRHNSVAPVCFKLLASCQRAVEPIKDV